jgi:hypothetical protein
MGTITPSPKSVLQEWLAKQRPAVARRAPTDQTMLTWLGMDLRVGDTVVEHDSRHFARLDVIFPNLTARITYVDTGWRADVQLTDLTRVDGAA